MQYYLMWPSQEPDAMDPVIVLIVWKGTLEVSRGYQSRAWGGPPGKYDSKVSVLPD
jgi:hypothetical protein